jgi:hypothetical protein
MGRGSERPFGRPAARIGMSRSRDRLAASALAVLRLVQRVRRGPQSDSHGRVSTGSPTIPAGWLSRARFWLRSPGVKALGSTAPVSYRPTASPRVHGCLGLVSSSLLEVLGMRSDLDVRQTGHGWRNAVAGVPRADRDLKGRERRSSRSIRSNVSSNPARLCFGSRMPPPKRVPFPVPGRSLTFERLSAYPRNS